jgi:hypothetical protein
MRVSPLLLLVLAAAVAGADQTSRPVNWDRARAELARYRAIADNSGLVEVDAQISPHIDAENLVALCEGRREAVRRARQIAEDGLRALPPGRDPITDERRAQFHRQLGAVASFEGDMPRAARHFVEARDALTPYVNDYPDLRARRLALEQAVGTAWLRQGELENCLTTSSADRCLFPVRPGGRHQHTRPGEAALQHFTSYLQAVPNDLEGRWLVNVTAMVLGRYPEGVPEPFRMAPALFAS